MPEDLEHHSTQPPRPRHQVPKKIALIIVIIAVLIAGFGVFYYESQHKSPPFPPNIASSVNYGVYYPSPSVNGYGYKAGSAKIQNGIVFYTLQNDKKSIYFTEQAAPTGQINLSSLPKHNTVNLPIGRGFVGTGLGNPSIVILTNSTLIEITSSKGVSATDLADIAQKLTQQN